MQPPSAPVQPPDQALVQEQAITGLAPLQSLPALVLQRQTVVLPVRLECWPHQLPVMQPPSALVQLPDQASVQEQAVTGLAPLQSLPASVLPRRTAVWPVRLGQRPDWSPVKQPDSFESDQASDPMLAVCLWSAQLRELQPSQ